MNGAQREAGIASSGELVADLLDAAAAERPEHEAIVHGDQRITYAELQARADVLASTLAAACVRAGDRVAVVLPNGPDWVASFVAVGRAGAVAVPLNPRYKQAELEFCCGDAGVRAIVCDRHGMEACEALAGRLTGEVAIVVPEDVAAAGDARPADPERGGDDQALLVYSSGATGRPKRVPRRHRHLLAEAEGLVASMGLTFEDRVFCAIPLFHTYGLGCCLMAALRAQATLVLLADAHPFVLQRERALRVLERERATVFPAVPFTLRMLADAPMTADLSSLRLCFSAAIALPRSIFDAFDRAFGIPVRQLYGCTEAGAVTANLDADPRASAASVGRPLPGVEVRVLAGDGSELPAGHIGDIVLRGPGMTEGYGGADELNREAFRDGFFVSGDRGRMDEQGRLFITGRTKLLIDVGGGDKVDPIEVEDVLAVHPRVTEVAVVGTASELEGESLVKAVVVADGPCQERELIRYCRQRLAEYKVPRIVEFVDEIPKGVGGKVLRKYLLD